MNAGRRRKERWKKEPKTSREDASEGSKRAKTSDKSGDGGGGGGGGDGGPLRYMGHEFTTLNSVITIPTACELCSSFTWLKEKGLVCSTCKLTCHKKCYTKIKTGCDATGVKKKVRGDTGDASVGDFIPLAASTGLLFGVYLDKLTTGSQRVAPIVERLISTIELVGLYTEGLYRKSGVSSRVMHLKRLLEDEASARSPVVDLKEHPVHVLTAVLKSFLRDLPQPLLTFERYDDFLRAADIADEKERISALMSLVHQLPQQHFDLLERLIFHLTRVARNESSNRMSPNSLAIVFAPCILRTSKVQQAQDSLSNVSKQTSVVESILNDQLRKVRTTLNNIDTLDSACVEYSTRLTSLRTSKMFPPAGSELSSASPSRPESLTSTAAENITEENLIQQQLEELREEKAALAATLPSLARMESDDDLLSTDGDIDAEEDSPLGEGSMDDVHLRHPPQSGSRLRGISISSYRYK